MKRLLPTLFCFFATTAAADLATVAVASNFAPVFEKISQRFEAQSTHRVRMIAGSSGKLYAQIVRGAPFDLFLSADSIKPKALTTAGRAQHDSLITYAFGELVLWANAETTAEWKDQSAPDVLRQSQFKRVAIANPALAPYGLAAQQVLQSLTLYSELRTKLIVGENVSQVFHFVHSKNADIGFVSKSQIDSLPQNYAGLSWPIPPDLHSTIRQDMVLLGQATSDAAVALHRYLQTQEIRTLIVQSGYRRFDS